MLNEENNNKMSEARIKSLKELERKESKYSKLEENSISIEDRMRYRKLKNKYSDLADRLYNGKNIKTCVKCDKKKDLSLFSKNGYNPDRTQRYYSKCKSCSNPNGNDLSGLFVSETHKECVNCNEIKNIASFGKTGIYKGERYRLSTCKKCKNANRNWKSKLMSNLTSRANNRFRPDGSVIKSKTKSKDVNSALLQSLKEKQKGKCYWLGIDMDFTMEDKLRKPSVDRLDNSKGYEVDNIVLTTVFANTGRRDATTNQMSDFVKTYLKNS